MTGLSYQTILRSSSIMGGASLINILLGLIRNKIVALLLGPAGVGLIGLLISLMSVAGTLAALGFGPAGTRQIAAARARGDDQEIGLARSALFCGSLVLAVLGATIFFFLRNVLATVVLDDAVRPSTVGWLALGVFFSVAAGSQQALLNGLRRIGDLARIQMGSGVLSTIVGIAALLSGSDAAIAIFVLATPLATLMLGHFYVAKLDRVAPTNISMSALTRQWVAMLRLGLAFVGSGLLLTGGLLLIRVLVQRELGSEAVGQFQAAWTISMTYIGFVLSAMATDYYPRLAGAINDPSEARRLVNEQTEVALLLVGPLLIGMLALAPWLIRVLYTSEFAPAAEILQWQVFGDLLKIASWPLGFVLLAAGAGRTFVITEAIGIGVFLLGTWIGLLWVGIIATGASFALMYAIYLPLQYWLARRRIGMAWTYAVKRQFWLLLALAGLVMAIGQQSRIAAAVTGLLISAGLGLFCLARIAAIAAPKGTISRIAEFGRQIFPRFNRPR